jgi:hypothetical protein
MDEEYSTVNRCISITSNFCLYNHLYLNVESNRIESNRIKTSFSHSLKSVLYRDMNSVTIAKLGASVHNPESRNESSERERDNVCENERK